MHCTEMSLAVLVFNFLLLATCFSTVPGLGRNSDHDSQLVLDSVTVRKIPGDATRISNTIAADREIYVESQISSHEHVHGLDIHPSFSEYQLRVNEPDLCDPTVKQYSGYLDISHNKHLFFWFFESRTSPENAPIIIWMNGGPGCSSLQGAFFELGPCAIAEQGRSTYHNDYSWNNNANIIFLDQPIGTGYSYSDDGSTVYTNAGIAVDVYAFLQLFLTKFPRYAAAPLHIAAESWGGLFVPHIASLIFKNNQAMHAPTGGIKINLDSMVIANGMTDPRVQFESVPDYLCGGAPYLPWDPKGRECAALRRETPICTHLIEACYKFPSELTCSPASLHCFDRILSPLTTSGRNVYDLRKPCESYSDDLCYPEFKWIESWMNDPQNKKVLGADDELVYAVCNGKIEPEFLRRGEGAHNVAALIPELIDNGVRLLAFAGNTDGTCNYMGVERWMLGLEHNYHNELQHSTPVLWKTNDSRIVGEVRSAGEGAGNVTFIQVYEAGHMAPHDQPEVTLDMITRWITNVPFNS